MFRNVASELEFHRHGEFPDDLAGLAGFEQHADWIVMTHGLAVAAILLQTFMVDSMGFNNIMPDHHRHVLLIYLVNRFGF